MTRKVDQSKIKKILEKRGYPKGKVPKGYEVHHVNPKAEGGKETSKNIHVIPKEKHKKIHSNRRKRGNI